jgi:hypothetical protein
MTWEGLFTETISDIPQLNSREKNLMSNKSNKSMRKTNLGRSITGSRNKGSRVWSERKRHDIASMSRERSDLLPSFNIPKSTSHVSRRSDNLVVIEESAARKVSRVTREFSGNSDISFPSLE